MRRWLWLILLSTSAFGSGWEVLTESSCYKLGGVDDCHQEYSATYDGIHEKNCATKASCEDFVFAMKMAQGMRAKSAKSDDHIITTPLKGCQDYGDCQEGEHDQR